jgi:hypothetical protein
MEYVVLNLAGDLLALSGEILQVLFDVLIVKIYGVENKLDEADLTFEHFDCLLGAELGMLDRVHANTIGLLLTKAVYHAHDNPDGRHEATAHLQIVHGLQQVEHPHTSC